MIVGTSPFVDVPSAYASGGGRFYLVRADDKVANRDILAALDDALRFAKISDWTSFSLSGLVEL